MQGLTDGPAVRLLVTDTSAWPAQCQDRAILHWRKLSSSCYSCHSFDHKRWSTHNSFFPSIHRIALTSSFFVKQHYHTCPHYCVTAVPPRGTTGEKQGSCYLFKLLGVGVFEYICGE